MLKIGKINIPPGPAKGNRIRCLILITDKRRKEITQSNKAIGMIRGRRKREIERGKEKNGVTLGCYWYPVLK
jgi:hypothetical protein